MFAEAQLLGTAPRSRHAKDEKWKARREACQAAAALGERGGVFARLDK